jgi:nuclear GTP-binding protein
MPKKSAKSKSKRTTLKQKYKVIKKVKEHGRKLRKEARKSGKKHKAPADPGLPKQWPFKQELIAELDEKRRLILEAEAKKKAERKAARVQFFTQHNMSP